MPDIENIANDPTYDAQATAASKATIFVFIGTFLYMLYGTDISPGLIGGALFFIVGIFAVSLAISMPLMLIRMKCPKTSLIISTADVAITIVVTRWVYLLLFAT